MNKLLVKLVYLFRSIIVGNGVDFDKMMIIVKTKLTMDTRRVYMNVKSNSKNENRNHLNVVLMIYAFFGLLVGLLIFKFPTLLLAMIIFHAYILFMMAMTLITDFSTVLLDTADNQIILPRPVTSKTIFMARMVHIMIYLLQFTIALGSFPILFTFIKYGILAGLGFCLTTFLTVLIAVFTTYLFYLVMMRITSEQKIKEVITYFQIFMTIFFAVGYQILPRMVNLQALDNSFTLHWYSYLLPPVWMALFIDALHAMSFDTLHIIMAILSIGVPILSFWILNRFFAPYFSKKLAAMNTDAVEVKTKQKDAIKKRSLSEKMSGIFCRRGLERSAFEMTWKITGRDKQFRLQFYPGLAYIAIFVFVFVFKSNQGLAETWRGLPESKSFLALIYIPLFTISTGITFLSFNEKFQAAWIYYSTPIQRPGELITGSLKSLFVKFFVPVYLIMFALAFYIWGLPIVDDFFFGLCNDLLSFLIISKLSSHYLPFSRQPNTQQQTGKIVIVIFQMLIIGFLVFIHYLLLKVQPLIFYAIIPLLIGAILIMLRNLQKLSWSKIGQDL